ncbi:MAG: hypothetical protein JSU72_10805 [Deltaproteobacteria bacterium]|nr:MAG: hypothetical protein JSU72_10805 [Deltaproteobacteria bacterium]
MTSAVKLLPEKYNILIKISYSILVGVVGTTLIVGFLSTFLHIFKVARLTPLVIALNGLIAGYYLLDKTKDELRHKHATALIVAVVYVLFTFAILNVFFLYWVGEYILTFYQLFMYLIVGVACTELGILLAIKYFKLNQRNE